MPYPIERGESRRRAGPLVPSFLRRVGGLLETTPPAVLGGVVAVLLVVVTILDVVTPPALAFGLFYIVPIILASCWLGPRAAVLSVLLAGLGMLLADSMGAAAGSVEPMTRYWNAGVRTLLFFVVAAIQSALCSSLAHERELARTDPLTGVANARFFNELAYREQRRARRYRTPLTVGYLDLNGFRQINEVQRRRAGDQVLVEVAAALAGSIREIDGVARIREDEFAILLPQADATGARIVFDRITEALEGVKTRWPIAWSVGVVTFPAPPDETDELLRSAERLMYSVKSAGGGIRFAAISPASTRVHSPFGI